MKDARFGDVAPIWRILNGFGDKKGHLVIGDKLLNFEMLANLRKLKLLNQNLSNDQSTCLSYKQSGSDYEYVDFSHNEALFSLNWVLFYVIWLYLCHLRAQVRAYLDRK